VVKVPHEQFIRVWQMSHDIDEVSLRLRTTKRLVRLRATLLIGKDVPLKKLDGYGVPKKRRGRYVDWAELFRLANSFCPMERCMCDVRPCRYKRKRARA